MMNHTECLADILPEYEKKAKLIAQENESRLKECGAFSSSEFQDFRDRIARAYLKLIKESVPAIVIEEDNLIGFIKRGEYPDGYVECHIHSRITVDDVKIYSLSHDQHQSIDQRPQRICKSIYR